MESQTGVKPNPNQPHSPITGATILAIISVVLTATWIAFAYYKGSSTGTDGERILLLHPIVAILLIVLLVKIYPWVEPKITASLEIIMIGLWLFVTMLDVLMPFVFGFGFAYLFRFLARAIPFKKSYQRWITTVLIVLSCAVLLFWSGLQIGKQARQMSQGLRKFYYESVLPLIVGETLEAIAIEVIAEKEPELSRPEADRTRSNQANHSNTTYLSTNHGIYILNSKRFGITNGDIVGKQIRAIALTDKTIYAGTSDGLYRRAKHAEKAVWKKIEETPFDDTTVQAISVVAHDVTIEDKPTDASMGVQEGNVAVENEPRNIPIEIYVGTAKGLYAGDVSEKMWKPVAPEILGERSIVSIAKGEDSLYVVSLSAETDGTPASTDLNRLWVLEFSSMTCSAFPSEVPSTIQVIAFGENAGSPVLYAGTQEGIYQFNSWKNLWEPTPGGEYLPASISLLRTTNWVNSSTADGRTILYAGNKRVLRSNTTAQWPLFVEQRVGLLNTYKDTPLGLQVKAYLTEKIPSLAESTGEIFKWGSTFAGTVAFQFGGFIATVTFAFIVFVYAVQSFENYFRDLTRIIPNPHRDTVKAYLRAVDENMQEFLKGQFTVIAIVSVISCIVYWIIGVPFALLIGLLAGLCNAIPTFGPFIGGLFAFTAMLMGLAAGDFSLAGFLARSGFVLVAILGIQTIDNSLISPRVMSRAVDVEPLLIMFGVIVGGAFLGFWGVLLAIPILVVIKSIVAVSHRRNGEAISDEMGT